VSTDPAALKSAAPGTGTETAPDAAPDEAAGPPAGRGRGGLLRRVLLVLVAIVVIDVVAFVVVPPFPKGQPGEPVTGIPDLIAANIHFPAPHVIWPPAEGEHHALPLISAEVSITDSLFTMWVVMAVLLAVFFVAGRALKSIPGRFQNAVEYIWEALENWAVSLGGPDSRRHVPLYAAFFLFILFSNWSGLLPFVGRLDLLRAPTSDVNVTIGLALVAFLYFHYQGFRRLGVRGYLGKFFVVRGFKHGLATGLIDMFVGLIEFLLEFIKPVTLAMRLFGNIFGGEVALGVITALTIALVPAGILLLEGLLNFVQALIFSTLMLMYTIIAVESHHEEEHDTTVLAELPEGGIAPPLEGARATP